MPPQPTGTLAIASVDPTIGGEVTFTETHSKLKGNQYPLVYLECTVDGTVVYGQLDQPDAVFILGGGSSPWIDPQNPNYRAAATCQASLRVYPDGVTVLAETAPFSVPGDA